MPRPSTAAGSLRSIRRPRLLIAVVAAGSLALTACGGASSAPADASITRRTSLVVGAPVLGNGHKPDQSCEELAPLDPGLAAGGPNDPQRIAVVGDGPLDTLCALGLQDRVVAFTPSGGQDLAPRYLGGWVSELALAGADGVVDVEAVRAAAPDLIIVGTPNAPEGQQAELAAIAPTVAASPAAGDWRRPVLEVGAGVGRGAAITAALQRYDVDAAATGERIAAPQTEVSMLRFTPDGTEILGESSLPGQVFAELGLRRPVSQRFDAPAAKPVDEADLRPAEGNVLYVAFEGKNTGRADRGGDTPAIVHGSAVMESDAWQALGVTGGRALVVDDGVWVDGGGLVAARIIVQDIRDSL